MGGFFVLADENSAQLLFDSRRPAFTVTQKVELGAPDIATPLDPDGVDQRAVGLKYTLYPGTV